MIPRSPIAGMLVAGALGLLLGSCSSPSKSSMTQPDTPVTTTADAETRPTSTSAPAPATTATTATTPVPTAATTGDAEAITAAFTAFFDGLDPDVDAKINVLEHGDLLRSMIVDASKDPQFQQLSTVVNSVSLLTDTECTAAGEVAPCALVAHDMFLGGLPAMVGRTSHAVRIDGVWKVSASSWCAIVAIGGASCPELPAS